MLSGHCCGCEAEHLLLHLLLHLNDRQEHQACRPLLQLLLEIWHCLELIMREAADWN
jgi:hypothetical protein